jgi:L-galactono-1,4-lactone dehydrogenase
VEQTIVLSRDEAKKQLNTLLKRHKHIRYMWIPYEDAVVVVTNDDENDLPLLGAGTEVSDGKGGKKKIVTEADIKPKHSREEQLEPLRKMLQTLAKNTPDVTIDEDTINGMGFGDLRDLILAYGNMLDPDHIKRCNKAEREFWVRAQGLQVLPSDQLLQFDCGGQQWVYEVCFPAGTYGMPSSSSMDFVDELLKEIETSGIPAPSPIEQRWTGASKSPLSPASVGPHDVESYDTKNALFSWVGVIMYLPSEDNDPTGYRREFITQAFKDHYCKLVRDVGEKYGIMCHWAKLEMDESDAERIRAGVRSRLGPRVISDYNAARGMFDPQKVLSCNTIEQVFDN